MRTSHGYRNSSFWNWEQVCYDSHWHCRIYARIVQDWTSKLNTFVKKTVLKKLYVEMSTRNLNCKHLCINSTQNSVYWKYPVQPRSSKNAFLCATVINFNENLTLFCLKLNCKVDDYYLLFQVYVVVVISTWNERDIHESVLKMTFIHWKRNKYINMVNVPKRKNDTALNEPCWYMSHNTLLVVKFRACLKPRFHSFSRKLWHYLA